MRVSDAFDLRMGKTPSRKNPAYWRDGGHDWVSIADLGSFGKYVGVTKERINDLAISESGIKPAPANTVLMSFKLSLGKTSITTEPVYTNEAIMAFVDKGVYPVDASFMYHQCRAKDWTAGTNTAVMGKTLNKKTLGQAYVHLPALEVQKMIAARLDFIDEQIRASKSSADKLEHLVKSRFVEMFGDPTNNEFDFPVEKLGGLGLLERGKSKHRPRNAPELRGGPNGPYPLIQTGDIANAGTYLATYEDTYTELGLLQSRIWPKGTLCITIAANIAKTSILAIDACFPDSVVGFTTNGKVPNLFMHYWFSFFQSILEKQAPQAAQKNINLRILQNLDVIAPPLALQREFADFVAQVDKSRFIAQQQIEKLQMLYDSLAQDYFGD